MNTYILYGMNRNITRTWHTQREKWVIKRKKVLRRLLRWIVFQSCWKLKRRLHGLDNSNEKKNANRIWITMFESRSVIFLSNSFKSDTILCASILVFSQLTHSTHIHSTYYTNPFHIHLMCDTTPFLHPPIFICIFFSFVLSSLCRSLVYFTKILLSAFWVITRKKCTHFHLLIFVLIKNLICVLRLGYYVFLSL